MSIDSINEKIANHDERLKKLEKELQTRTPSPEQIKHSQELTEKLKAALLENRQLMDKLNKSHKRMEPTVERFLNTIEQFLNN